jgi:hypothetical protein
MELYMAFGLSLFQTKGPLGEAGAAWARALTIAEVLADGGTRTPDLGGNAGSANLGAAITAAIR